MKKLAFFFVLMSSLSAAAGTPVVCTTQDSKGENYEFKSQNNTYQISHYGSSRNSYSAIYKNDGCIPSQTGKTCTISKIKDASTHKDMPQYLILRDQNTKTSTVFVIGGLTKSWVFFNKANCSSSTGLRSFGLDPCMTECLASGGGNSCLQICHPNR